MTYSEEQYQDILAVCRSYKNDYDRAFERLKSQQREIDALKAENEKRLTCDFVKTAQKQAKIDILNKAKEKLDSAPNGWAYTTYIDEMIEELKNDD